MFKAYILVIALLFFAPNTWGQIHPREGDSVNYRMVAFSFPPMQKAVRYTLQVATGNHDSAAAFLNSLYKQLVTKKDTAILIVPAFGANYSWRIVYTLSDSSTQYSQIHHFRTQVQPEQGNGYTRLRVTHAAEKYADAFVFLDHTRSMYNMNGELLWFLPKLTGESNVAGTRDLKLSSKGTITFLEGMNAYEMDYDGNILWKGPDNGKVNGQDKEYYHHDFTRLDNGHYMVLGNQPLMCKLPTVAGELPNFCATQKKPDSNSKAYRKIEFTTLIEYDAKGEVKWSWKSSDYYHKAHYNEYVMKADAGEFSMHENSFYFDERAKMIYISGKNFGVITKIKYPEGKIVAIYGSKRLPGQNNYEDTLFCGQHCMRGSTKGYLYLFNNNNCNPGYAPKVVILKEPKPGKGELQKLWEFDCPLDEENRFKINIAKATTGGSVYELPDNSIFTSLCSPYASVFIVNREKEILWSAIPEQYNKSDKKWSLLPQYRASIVTEPDKMETLLFNSLGGAK